MNSSMNPVNIETRQRYTRAYNIVYMDDVSHFILMEDPKTFNDHIALIINELTVEKERNE